MIIKVDNWHGRLAVDDRDSAGVGVLVKFGFGAVADALEPDVVVAHLLVPGPQKLLNRRGTTL